MKRVKHKKVVVVGGSQGIGKATALALADEGADVVIADKDIDSAKKVARQIIEKGQRSMAYFINVAEVSAFPEMVKKTVEEFSRVDILVYSAGVTKAQPLLDIAEEEWDWIFDINLKGLFFCIQAIARQMISQVPHKIVMEGRSSRSYGKIVTFSSISGRRGRIDLAHYAASKAAVISVTQSAALAFAQFNINVNAVSPSVVWTQMWEQLDRQRNRLSGNQKDQAFKQYIEKIPLKRAGTLKDMADAVLFLCSNDSDYITGQTINVDGGFEMN